MGIAYRALGYISKVEVTVNIPKTFPSVDMNAMMRNEAPDLNGGSSQHNTVSFYCYYFLLRPALKMLSIIDT
jgi:hypothetical protein